MLKLILLFSAAFWGDTQVREWAAVDAHYGVGLPLCNRLNVVEFTLGLSYIGIGSSIVESYGFGSGDSGQFIGSLLPLHVSVPLYQKIAFWRDDAFFKHFIAFNVRGSGWGQRYDVLGPLSYLLEPRWLAKAPYLAFELMGRWSPVRMVGLQATLGTLIVKDAAERIYLTLGVCVGTAGPASKYKIGPRLEVAGVVFDDAIGGNSNGILEPGEEGRLLVFLVNRGLKDSDTIFLKAVMRDPQLSEYLTILDTTIPPLGANRSIEVSLPVVAGDRLPAIPLRLRVWGKDSQGNMVSPANIEIPTVGS
ncbi:MAG: hypothetical protein E3J71_08055 [Candidatus Stahlbacteria bacterium]|nr:MAG: hypothetical protein E3J71_08055 [Candidatus Stahlbacteria bacterium]